MEDPYVQRQLPFLAMGFIMLLITFLFTIFSIFIGSPEERLAQVVGILFFALLTAFFFWKVKNPPELKEPPTLSLLDKILFGLQVAVAAFFVVADLLGLQIFS